MIDDDDDDRRDATRGAQGVPASPGEDLREGSLASDEVAGAGPSPLSIDDDVGPSPRPLPRSAGIVLAVISAGCLIAACFSHRWLANRRAGDFGYSPLSYEDCRSTCQVPSNFQVFDNAGKVPFEEQRVSRAFPIAGAVTFTVLLVAAAGLLVAAAIAAVGQRPNLPVFPTTIALLAVMIGLVSGCVFVATKPGAAGSVGVAWSFRAFGIGSVAGLAGAQLLARQIRPADPDLLDDAMNLDQF
jgi:hypothetical protein